MKKFYVIFVVVGMMLSGCGSQEVQAPKKAKVIKKEVKKQTLPASKTPAWIANPDLNGNLGAVGVVKLMKNKKKQRYIAKKLAVGELQERKRVMMSSSVDTKEVVKNGKVVESDLTHTIKQTSSHINSDIIIKKAEYSDGENYYVWMVVQQ